MAPKTDSWVRIFKVSDPFKHPKGFTLYKVTSIVYCKKYPETATKIIIWKRYNDFKKLHKELNLRHQKLHLTDKFPAFVKAKFFSRFEADVIDERMNAALLLLEFVGKHPPLFTSNVFVKFFESGYVVDEQNGKVVLLSELRPETTVFNSSILSTTGERTTSVSPLPNSSDEDHTSVTTDTDSALSSPHEVSEITVPEPLPVQSVQADAIIDVPISWPSFQEVVFENQTPILPTNSSESLFSKKIQSLKNKFIGNNEGNNDNKIKETPLYLTEAEQLINQAKESEQKDDHQTAFAFYKTAIACLLSGVQSDTDPSRRITVKEKTAEYLLKAEYLADNFLSEQNASKPEVELVPLSQLWQPVSDLQWFKVLGIIGKVMLVFDTRTHSLHIIKALHKSACPASENGRCIFPRQVPYMVELQAIYETDYSVYLILQHISAGKLWDYVTPYFQKQPETPAKVLQSSPYNHQNYLDIEDRISVSSSDSFPSALHTLSKNYDSYSTLSSPGDSYLNLIKDYTSTKKSESTRSLNSEVEVVPNVSLSENKLVKDIPDLTITHDNTQNIPISNNSNSNKDNSRLFSECLLSALSDDGLYKEVLDLVDSPLITSKSETDIRTIDLVNNAEKLLKSVDQVLNESDCLFGRLHNLELNYIDDVEDDATVVVKENDYLIDIKNVEGDKLSVGSNISAKYIDMSRLHAAMSSKGSSPVSSIGMDPQWCQLEVEGGGITEQTVKRWAAQLLLALQHLHKFGIICMDLNPDNILVCGGTLRLTYFCRFPSVDPTVDVNALKKLYCAPEVNSIFQVTFSADWWSYGVILYQLLSGQSLYSYHPGGIQCHTSIYIPENISIEARFLLKELLKYNPSERIGAGLLGIEEIKSHPFFEGIDWDTVYQEGLILA